MQYLVFGAWKDEQGGGHDYLGARDTIEEAQAFAERLEFVSEPRMSSWVHIAEYDPEAHTLRVTLWLAIPGTEQGDDEGVDDDDDPTWVWYE